MSGTITATEPQNATSARGDPDMRRDAALDRALSKGEHQFVGNCPRRILQVPIACLDLGPQRRSLAIGNGHVARRLGLTYTNSL